MAGKSRKTNRSKKSNNANDNREIRDEIIFLISAAVTILLFLCNFHIMGSLGNTLSKVMFGIFGYMAYVASVLIFFAICFFISNIGNKHAIIKLIAGIIAFIMMCVFFTLICDVKTIGSGIADYYRFSSGGHTGGGVIGGLIGKGMYSVLGMLGSVAVLLLVLIICLVLLTERSFVKDVKRGGAKAFDITREEIERRKEINKGREEEKRELRRIREERRREADDEEDEYINDARKLEGRPYSKKRGRGMASMDALDLKNAPSPDPTDLKAVDEWEKSNDGKDKEEPNPISSIKIRGIDDVVSTERELHGEIGNTGFDDNEGAIISEAPIKRNAARRNAAKKKEEAVNPVSVAVETTVPVSKPRPESISATNVKRSGKKASDYRFPPLSLLTKGSGRRSNDGDRLRETAKKLVEALKTFGVNVTLTEISKGPAVTRFEVQPEAGVKVNKIVSLTDDLKLNMAAKDIRIEAPIPGKMAVGIEIPNDESEAVHFRDLLESPEYRNSHAGLTFAVGKDLSGQTIVSDIAKMPHLLIAGSTGSGKSVCINTIIMSILYKAKPDEVKLIMIDPKVVELSIYNGIPHLMLPVVTDPKKASAALQWAVAEMSRRYDEFGRLNVRNIQGYNEKIVKEGGDKMPLILIIVDEMADLMMVASNEVEAAVCRLAQLARAAGIHLVIATQRPSVDVITGLIKANFPSRIAFAVSSGVDSRTILDKVGAERLLGKGDMLFDPQGSSEPKRVQGAFISDGEINRVVDHIKAQGIEAEGSEELSKQIDAASDMSGGGFTSSSDDRDPLFADAGKYIIDKEKASIGNLQRVFKIGFNRAARIMDQLEEAGVVGPEEGTKPRRVLMDMAGFESVLES